MFAGASDFFQSKSSILKKAGAASKAKKVHFDTMKTKSWSSSNASKKKKQSPPKEAPHCSTGVASLPATEVFEVEAIQDHKKVCIHSTTRWQQAPALGTALHGCVVNMPCLV